MNDNRNDKNQQQQQPNFPTWIIGIATFMILGFFTWMATSTTKLQTSVTEATIELRVINNSLIDMRQQNTAISGAVLAIEKRVTALEMNRIEGRVQQLRDK